MGRTASQIVVGPEPGEARSLEKLRKEPSQALSEMEGPEPLEWKVGS